MQTSGWDNRMNKKIIVVGDNHIHHKTPENRTGDYLTDTTNKLLDCLELGKLHKVDAVVFLGDLFDKYEVSTKAVCMTMNILKGQANGDPWPFKKFITIGNHDINNNYPLDKCSLGILIESEVLTKVDHNEELSISFAHYVNDLDKEIVEGLLAKSSALIWSCHASIGSQKDRFEEYIVPFSDVPVHENNIMIFSGHIHHPMSVTRDDGKRFINPGAIGRYSASKDNLERTLKVFLFEYDLDGNIYNEEYLDLPSFRNGDDAFKKEEILAKKELKEQTKEFIANIQSIKTNNWANTNIVDKIAFLKESAVKNNLEERVIEVALEAVKEANIGVSK